MSKPQASHANKTKDDAKPGAQSRRVATTLITRVLDDGRNLDALCDHQHGLKAYLTLSDKDRGLARAIAITALRNHNRIGQVLKQISNRPPPKNARFLIHTLHVAIAQVLFMDVPESAAVNLAVSAIGEDKRTSRFKSFANAILRRLVREKDKFADTNTNDVSPFPKWLEKAFRRDFGKERLEKINCAVMQPPVLDLTVKSNPSLWAEKLGGTVLANGSVRLSTNDPVPTLEGYEAGEWWVQDAAASMPASLIDCAPGARVLELCAAPGGKTAQLANAGFEVTALDISAPRLKRLKENLTRLNLEATLVEADILDWEPEELFDAVLLDAPCSSTGTIRRHPDVMWARNPQEITELARLQLDLIIKASGFVKPGGTFVFSNCSMLKEEGEDLLQKLANMDTGLERVELLPKDVFGMSEIINGQGAVRSLPFHMAGHTDDDAADVPPGMDGFFACKFVKN